MRTPRALAVAYGVPAVISIALGVGSATRLLPFDWLEAFGFISGAWGVWLQVGEKDNGYQRDEASLHNWVLANQRMAAALKAKGYHYRYVFSAGAGHVDRKVVNQTLPEALLWLWQGYAAKEGSK